MSEGAQRIAAKRSRNQAIEQLQLPSSDDCAILVFRVGKSYDRIFSAEQGNLV